MPPGSDLLTPIPGDNPSGQSLRYAPVFDKIKEARREDDDAAQGDWKRERKLADWPFVVKSASEVIATRSKDVQLAAWLTEALVRTRGAAGLREGLDLLKGLLVTFWDTLYPELEDGDMELRAAPLEWVGTRLDQAVKGAPLTKSGYNWFDYKQSRAIATEEEAAQNPSRASAREAAIGEGKLTPEEFDKAFEASPRAYYAQQAEDFAGALESLRALDDFCIEKFQDAAPSFGSLKRSLEEVEQAIRIFLQKKREKEPDDSVAVADPEEAPVEEEVAAGIGAAAAPAGVKKAAGAPAGEPVDRADAVARVVAAAKYLRTENQYDPSPYLMLRGLRWGELRAAGETIDQTMLAPPSTEIRQGLKRLSLDANWTEVLEVAESAMGMECGRGWLDLQRYVARACREQGGSYEPIRSGVISGLRGLLADYPQLPELTLMDDTPTANAETLAWIKDQVWIKEQAWVRNEAPVQEAGVPVTTPDVFELAMQSARQGRPQDGIELLMREMAQEPSGRARFHRKVQLAQLCVSSGHDGVAFPILQEVAAEIERRKLEDWEASEVLAQPLALLYKCLAQSGSTPEEIQKLYSWICRLDPLQAMNMSR